MNQSDPDFERRWATVEQATAHPIPKGERSAPIFAHGSMLVKYYAPRGSDEQTPHTRDELYVVVRGSGWFVNGDRRHPFAAGDVLFVPAGVPHRFEDFTDDFGTWVVFYGPEGGERSSSHK
jgi:mannose-6-phosphate isomerase-like protein (cupin superfamily)